jgi:hypothetical protein
MVLAPVQPLGPLLDRLSLTACLNSSEDFAEGAP